MSEAPFFLQTLGSRIELAYNAANATELANLYELDALLISPTAERAHHADEAFALIKRYTRLGGTLAAQVHHIHHTSNLAFVRMETRITDAMGPDNQPFSSVSQTIKILRRRPDGIWKIAMDCALEAVPQ